ncbi:MAG TPA: CDP-archaeol synthase, partial [Candidatus Saccharimonadales bacterium]|nr:CDP-archaeol synthase [Candidatus Saccharimonadales bacterium]
MSDFLFTLWFFLPAGVANVVPVLIAKAPFLSNWNMPVDFGLKYRGKPILGAHKTIRGLTIGTLAGFLVFVLQVHIYESYSWAREISDGLDYSELSLWLGLLLGFGALFGDMLKSFFKRQLSVASGKSWFPFDQLDYIAGALLFSSIVITLEAGQYILIAVIWFLMHLLTSYLGY